MTESTVTCAHCGQENLVPVSNEHSEMVPAHNWPKLTRQVCPGSRVSIAKNSWRLMEHRRRVELLQSEDRADEWESVVDDYSQDGKMPRDHVLALMSDVFQQGMYENTRQQTLAHIREVFPRIARYDVSIFPDWIWHSDNWHIQHEIWMWVAVVKYMGAGRWAVIESSGDSSLPRVWGTDGKWEYEGSEQRGDEEWLRTHRFDLPTALDHAREQAPLISVMGHTARDVLRDLEERFPDERNQ